FNITGIPSGVTVTFPSSITTSAGAPTALAATADIVWTARAGDALTNGGTGTSMLVRYDSAANGSAVAAVPFTTGGAAAAGTDQTIASPTKPTIGVTVGSVSGSGTALISIGIGPTAAPAATLGADDVSASAIPRYSTAGPAVPGRVLVAAA